MESYVFGIACGIFAILIYKAIEMAVKEYRKNKGKWWLR
jgi:hypothetical protein